MQMANKPVNSLQFADQMSDDLAVASEKRPLSYEVLNLSSGKKLIPCPLHIEKQMRYSLYRVINVKTSTYLDKYLEMYEVSVGIYIDWYSNPCKLHWNDWFYSNI